ncbi:MAG TPA: hypothetical protein PKA56_11000 [Solirubrobacterales bacterium]|nr:hypothetical protein [Solirubrobacterales bacterium]HMU26671.1 hypothetical protein [Solirubrobacterales bacterium]HMW44395.1 hypothetical protein [Solirubrobacterales bacterium]HMX72266.1 hypothetical protein [Solirubrobacterales bacterium]HMY26632.1 hypothetical protein [Solirubrobacterales bacterium]
MTEISDANQLRGAKFKELMSKAKTWIIIVVCSVIAAAAGMIVGPAIAGGAFVLVFLIGIVITFMIADSRAATAFYEAYAQARGLTHQSGGILGGSTPLLRKGDRTRVDQQFNGMLSEGIEGTLALYTYTVTSTDSKGNETSTDYPFTVIMVNMPGTVQHLTDLRVQRQSGLKLFEKFEDAFRGDFGRVTLESEAMRDRYEIFVRKEQDPVWVRRLFSPSFIVWLTDSPPKKFAFELENGWLCAYVPKHRDDTEGFDEMIRLGTHVAGRLEEEVGQSSPAEAHHDSPEVKIEVEEEK